MFGNIHFIVTESGTPMENSSDLTQKLKDTEYADYSEKLSAYHFFEKCTFCIDGISYILPMYPISENAMNNLTYVQSFSMLDARGHFFTRRSGTETYMLLYTYEGKGLVEYDGKRCTQKRGDGMLIDCRREHYYATDGNRWKHSVLHFSGACVESILEAMNESGSFCFHEEPDGDYQKKLERVLELYDSVVPFREIQISSLLQDMLTGILTASSWYQEETRSIPEEINNLVRYIGRNYEKKMSLTDLAALSNMSKYHLCRQFKRYTGYSPTEYIIWQRIEHAKSLLRSTQIPASQIGSMVGIPDENYFYRLFRKQTGCSPNSYRGKR